jgi:hypothetical protein
MKARSTTVPIKPWRATCIQMPSRVARTAADRGEAWAIITGNIERGLMLIDRSVAAEQPAPRLVLLPEFAFQGPPRGDSVDEWIGKACYPVPGEITAPFQAKAAELGIYIGGNQFEADPEWPHRHFNTSWLIDPAGEVILRYRRIHTAQWVSPHDLLDAYIDRYGVDGTGHTVLPGLVDAHAHVAAVMCGAELQTQDASAFGSFFIDQFLRFGVTAVRDTDDVREQWHAESFTLDWEAEDFGWGRIELERQMQFVGLAASAGVRVAAGTDTPNPFVLPGQSMHDELELLVGSGLTPMQAIVAGTSRAAELAGLADRIGAVKPGYCADLLVVRGDPVSSITATRSVALVIKSGRIVFAENPAPSSPAGM